MIITLLKPSYPVRSMQLHVKFTIINKKMTIYILLHQFNNIQDLAEDRSKVEKQLLY